MLYVFYGSDTEKAGAKMRTLLRALVEKRPDASRVNIDADSWNAEMLPELTSGQGLFERRQVVVCRGLLENKETRDTALAHIKDIAASENIFVFLDGELSPAVVKAVSKHAERVQAYEEKTAAKPFNIFSLADALGARDRKGLWVLYHKAKAAGVSDEEILGTLFWQARVLLAARSGSAEEAGLSPFVFQKAKRFAAGWGSDAERPARTLLSLYHDARAGERDLPSALERFCLTLL